VVAYCTVTVGWISGATFIQNIIFVPKPHGNRWLLYHNHYHWWWYWFAAVAAWGTLWLGIITMTINSVAGVCCCQPSDSVTNRVAGFICKYIFTEHQSTVTSLVVVSREHVGTGTYMVSSRHSMTSDRL